MTRIVDWATAHSRMVLACILLSIGAGLVAYFTLPKEGSPDIEIPAYFISISYPGVSAQDSERLLVQPMETALQDLDGLKELSAIAAEGYAGITLSFEFGLDRAKILADVREKVSRAQSSLPSEANRAVITEFSFSDFPILVIVLSGDIPERTLLRVAKQMQRSLEEFPEILKVDLSGSRDEVLGVTIDPLQLEAYNVSASELINTVVRNNQLIAAGNIETPQGSFAVKIPSSYDDAEDVRNLPIKVNGDRIVTLGDLSEIQLTFADRLGTARYNGNPTLALQVVKRKGTNIIDTAAKVRQHVEFVRQVWPEQLREAINVEVTQDQSYWVDSMVTQLESAVLTAVALVMIVVLATLGVRSSLLVGFAIPTSFLLCFTFLAIMKIPISNIVMFGLILAVGMLVDSAIVVVEYADRRIREGVGPMMAYSAAAKRMFWPIVSSTATTLCAFIPMLFWPGVPGQFMGKLPVTIIFVLSASLFVALIFLPVIGGLSGRASRSLANISDRLAKTSIVVRLLLVPISIGLLFASLLLILTTAANPNLTSSMQIMAAAMPGIVLFLIASPLLSISLNSINFKLRRERIRATRGRTVVGHLIAFIVGNPIMPVVSICAILAFVGFTFQLYMSNNLGIAFFRRH